jgi:hypothetical protein
MIPPATIRDAGLCTRAGVILRYASPTIFETVMHHVPHEL